MKIHVYNPDYPQDKRTDPLRDLGSGVSSYMSWENLAKQIGALCGLRRGEKVIGIEVSDDGIYIRFTFK